MSTGIAVSDDRAQGTREDPVGLGPILVATDGTTSSDAALKAAADLGSRTGAGVVVLTVSEPLPLVAADYGVLLPPADAEPARNKALLERVQSRVVEMAGPHREWRVELREGDPATVIASTARELRARIVIVGIGHHELLDRVFGDEIALRALRLSNRPVFAVSSTYTGLPQKAVVATDFSAPSVRAARTALELFDSLTSIYIVHVAPRLEMQPEAFAAWTSLYGEDVGAAFERVKTEIGIGGGTTVETITLRGKPSRETLEFARTKQVDLIVTGSRGAGLLDRLLVGSTATGVIRGAQCSVLAVPVPRGVEHPFGTKESSRAVVSEAQWAAELDSFTRRNAGRRTSLEVDDPEFGAQAQEHDYPFLGVAYDHHDRRVEIMLGDFEGVRRHLTRGIADVRAIDVVRDEQGRDWSLRIAHGDGQTILTFMR